MNRKIAQFLALLSLIIVITIYARVEVRKYIPSLPTKGQGKPVRVDWRVAIVSGDSIFISQVKQALIAREFKECTS